MAAIIKESLS